MSNRRYSPTELGWTVQDMEAFLRRRIYINDNGVVSCNEPNCRPGTTIDGDGFTFEGVGRRTTIEVLLEEMIRHWKEECQ